MLDLRDEARELAGRDGREFSDALEDRCGWSDARRDSVDETVLRARALAIACCE